MIRPTVPIETPLLVELAPGRGKSGRPRANVPPIFSAA
jgi:hypothetical protein